jgi:hypothetical protein
VPFLEKNWVDLMAQIKSTFTYWPQGRPLNHSVPMLFGFVGFRLGGVKGIYLLVFCVLLINGWLVAIVSRCSPSAIPALLAGATFIFCPADTTRLLITHGAHLHLSLTYSLIGLLLLRSSVLPVRILAYAVSLLSLLSYETAYTIFAVGGVFYLLCVSTGSWSWKPILTHVVLCAIIVGGVAIIRASLGESHIITAAAQPAETLWRMVSSLWIGPATSLSSYWRAWTYGMFHLDGRTIWTTVLVLVVLVAAIIVLSTQLRSKESSTSPTPAWLIVCGVSIIIGSYGLTITDSYYPPIQTAGRLTATHLAAAVGIALSVGGLLGTLESKFGRRALVSSAYVTAFALAGTMPYLFKIQKDYAAAWSNQKEFCVALLRILPDLEPDDMVLMAGLPPRETKSILSNSWADPLVLRNLVTFEQGEEHLSFAWLDSAEIELHSDKISIDPEPWFDHSRRLPAVGNG